MTRFVRMGSLVLLALGALFGTSRPAAADIVDFEDLPLQPNSFNNQGTTFVGPLPGDPSVTQNTFTSRGAVFNNLFNTTFGSWSGWSYSNVVNILTPGFGNQYAAYNLPGGGGDGSPNYGVAFDDTFTPGGRPTITLPAGSVFQSARVTNTTYAALSMLNGDAFSKKFGGTTGNDPDFFLLTVEGFNGAQRVGAVEFFLADYRFADNQNDYVVSSWTTLDLSSLAGANRLAFGLTSSDNGPFGMNTPAFLALDNFQLQSNVTPIPEPTLALWVAGVGVAPLLARRLRRRWLPVDGN
jgi:hypothetical protein